MSQIAVIGGGGGGGAGTVVSLTGNAGGAVGPTVGGNINVVGSGTITVVGTPLTNTLTISSSGGSGFTWSTIGASGPLVVNNGYICTTGAALSFSLPAVSAVGDQVALSLDGSTSWTITQGAGQQIRFGVVQTTSGVGGSLASTGQGDTVILVCSVANLRWNVVYGPEGNITIV